MTGTAKSIVCLAVEAMKCRFELILAGDDPTRIRAVGEEALEEIGSLGRKLNFYSPSSLLSRINRDASASPITLDARLYQLLTVCRDVHHRTDGAFDPTISPLLDAWGFSSRRARRPSQSELDNALKRVGFEKVLMDDENRTVRLTQGATLNLSSIAKGYALDCAAEILREHGIEVALLHGGTSSVLALGVPPSPGPTPAGPPSPLPDRTGLGWKVEVSDPRAEDNSLLSWSLKDEALSASGNHLNLLRLAAKGERASAGPRSEVRGSAGEDSPPTRVGHVIDPRTGHPIGHTLLAAVTTDLSAALPAARADGYASAALVDSREPPLWRHHLKRLHRQLAS